MRLSGKGFHAGWGHAHMAFAQEIPLPLFGDAKLAVDAIFG